MSRSFRIGTALLSAMLVVSGCANGPGISEPLVQAGAYALSSSLNEPADGGGWGGSGHLTVSSNDGGMAGSGDVAPPDSTGDERGGMAGSGH